jgi:hypothetical protein
MAKICSVIVLLMVGCSSAVESQPEVKPVDTDSFISSVNVQAKAIATTLAAQKLTGEMTLENTQAIITKLNKLEASLASPKPQQSGGDPASALQPPAKNANDSQTSTKIVAEPGAVPSETLTELATRLYSQGVSVHMKTREQLEAIDAQLNGGQPVTGGIFQNNRTSAVTSQRSTVRLVPRGKGVVRWQRNSAGQACGPNGCY